MLKPFSADAATAQPVISLESGSEVPPPVWPVPRLPRKRTRKETVIPAEVEIEDVADEEFDAPDSFSYTQSSSGAFRLDS